MAAAEILSAVVAKAVRGDLLPTEQDLTSGRVYRRRDFTADAVRTLWKDLDDGMMERYVAEQDVRQKAYPIVESL